MNTLSHSGTATLNYDFILFRSYFLFCKYLYLYIARHLSHFHIYLCIKNIFRYNILCFHDVFSSANTATLILFLHRTNISKRKIINYKLLSCYRTKR